MSSVLIKVPVWCDITSIFVLHSNYSVLVHSELQHNTVIQKSLGKAISIHYNCNSIHVECISIKLIFHSFLRLRDWNWLLCAPEFVISLFGVTMFDCRSSSEISERVYLDVWLCTHGDNLVQFSVEDHLTDGSVVCVGHLHCVLYSPSQGPWVDHTGSYQEIKIVPNCLCNVILVF